MYQSKKISVVFGLNASMRQITLLACMLIISALACGASNIPDLKEQQLHPQYWQKKVLGETKMAMNSLQITTFNQQLFATNPNMVRPLSMPNTLNKASLLEKIGAISQVPSSARFYDNGEQLSPADYQNYLDNLNLQAVKAVNKVTFALVSQRSVLRTFPTYDRVFNAQMDRDLDRFQETGVFPGEPLAVLHQSADAKWALVQNYNYLAWMPIKDLAIGDKSQIERFVDVNDFLVMTGAKVMTSFVPNEPGISQVQLDMGVKLPVVDPKEQALELYGQSTAGSYQVKLPVRKADGSLEIQTAFIGRTQDVSLGYLDYTPQNVIAQAFKFLGERYGWGHDYNGRDCTGFVGEIFKTFGILMPRNSGQQGKGEYGTNFRFDNSSAMAAKLEVINNMQVGDLIYIPGHVMMYLGNENDQPFVIHDVKGLAYWTTEGDFYQGVLNAVSVTPLIKLHLNESTRYVDKIYNIKRITLQTK